jgi:diguanylate cyclase (GGDEF)-like protein/PAS domain S-box-containing protein
MRKGEGTVRLNLEPQWPRLATSEDPFRALVDSVRDYAIFLTDPAGIVRSWNSGAEHVFGFSGDQVIGNSIEMLYPPADAARQKHKQHLETAVRVGRVEEDSWRLRADGMRFSCHFVLTPLRDADGELYGYGVVARDLTEQQRRDEELRRTQTRSDRFWDQAIKDPLTGVFNRRYMFEHVRGEMDRAGEKAVASLLVFDVDRFKDINDRLGHDKGDLVLMGICAIARRQSRSQDLLFRMGGDEFVMYMPGVNAKGAMHLAERLRSGVERATMPSGPVTISIGVADRKIQDSLETWLQRADVALYRAKAAGRNRVA